jgi:ABC-type glycerol-3-phosphate transport system substrate-binding protein
MDHDKLLNRKAFLKTGALAGAGLAAFTSPLGAQGVAMARHAERLARRPLNPADQINLKFQSAGSPAYGKFFKAASAAFMKLNPNVSVDYQQQGRDYRTKLLVEIAGGAAPDVAAIPDDIMHSYAAHNALVDLAPFWKADGMSRAPYWPAAINPQWLGPHLFSLPYDYGLHIMYYNKALFDKQHQSYPTEAWTWDDYVRVGRNLTIDRNGKRASDAGFQADHVVQYAGDTNLQIEGTNSVVRSFGGEWASPNLSKALLDTPAAIKAFQWMADVGAKYNINPAPDVATSLNFALEQGNVAMHFDGTWSFGTYSAYPLLKWDQGNVDILPFLKGPKGRAVVAEASGVGMTKGVKSQNAKWAWELIKFIGSEAGQRLAFQYGVASITNFKSLTKELIPTIKQPKHRDIILRYLPQAKLPYWCEAISDQELEGLLFPPFGAATELLDLFNGKTTAAKAMPVFNKRVQALLDTDQKLAKQLGATLQL